MNQRIAFVTCAQMPNLYDDDRSALPALCAQGYEVEAAIWNSPDVVWSSYDAIVIRSAWYYWLTYDLFLQWIAQIEDLKIPLLTPASILKDNSRKDYLKRLADKGIHILPTQWIEPKQNLDKLELILKNRNWQEAILKPTVSGGAYRTYRITLETAADFESALTEILSESGAMIQPFVSTILSEGELSFLFYGDEFSHAAIKKGPVGEFRIQRTFGGTVTSYAPQPGEVEQAQAALQAYSNGTPLLYARVDMIRDPSDPARLLLMELEATEPNIFFLHDQQNPGAATRFALALKKSLRS